MEILSLSVRDFRNYENFSVNFQEGVNLIYGKNGVGKTNLLEAIFLFASGKSFRGSKEKEMVNFLGENAKIKLVFKDRIGIHTLEAELFKNRKKILYRNGIEIKKLSEYLGLFRAVIFTPDHLSLIKGSPEFRRKFLDVAMCQSFPRYVAILSDYNKILNQKNALLKNENPNEILLDVYNERLSVLGASITKSRGAFLSRLCESAGKIYFEMTDKKETLSIFYETQTEKNSEDLKKSYFDLFERKKQTEILKKMCLYGAQRDDFSIFINGKNARLFASQGQQRSAVLSLKMSEGELSKSYTGEECVYLLDDILSELDAERKNFVLKKLQNRQFIITCCEDVEKFSAVKKIQIKRSV